MESGAMEIFIMEEMPVVNKRPTTCPLVVSLADGSKVTLTHMWDIHIDGLLVVLTGHIILELSIASLFGIVVLTEVGCKVQFDKSACMVWYCHKLLINVPYMGTFGVPDQGQTLDVQESQTAKSALRDDWTRNVLHHTLEVVLEVTLEHMCTGLRP